MSGLATLFPGFIFPGVDFFGGFSLLSHLAADDLCDMPFGEAVECSGIHIF